MRVAVGSDHAGFELKTKIERRLRQLGHQVQDEGTYSTESADYPDIARKVARKIQSGQTERGILVCGTGIGMAIAANKFRGIRAAVCHDLQTAVLSREHNDANVLTIAGRGLDPALALAMVEQWIRTEFLGERHARRVEKIQRIEEENFRQDRQD